MAITEYSNETIAEIFIIGGMLFCSLSVSLHLNVVFMMISSEILCLDIDTLHDNLLVSETGG